MKTTMPSAKEIAGAGGRAVALGADVSSEGEVVRLFDEAERALGSLVEVADGKPELLQRAGLRILARNWRCRHGEIDLVAEEGGTLVFAEVRLRRNPRFGGAAESVTAHKPTRLLPAARG